MTSDVCPSGRLRPRASAPPRFLLPTLLLFVGGAGPLAAQFTPTQAILAQFDAEVAAEVAGDAAGAVSVAVFRDGGVVWEKGWGWADIEEGVPADAHTLGRTGSISKTFTAVLMMQLAERGLVDLDEPVANHLPEVEGLAEAPGGAEPVTFRMLAAHTAGLIREPELEGAAAGSIYLWEEKVLESIPHTRFQTAPLTEYSYSNIGYGILGLALSRAAGQPFMELMDALVFGPLGMRSSTFILDSPELIQRMSVGYSRNANTGEVSAAVATREHFGRGYKVPNGGIYSSVGDLARFGAALMGRGSVQILSEESRREMLAPQAPAEGYGLGLQLYEVDGVPVAGHGGSVAGYNAHLAFHPETGWGVAALRTTGYNPPTAALLAELVQAELGPEGAGPVGR